jgi:hypothetical protein
MYPAVRASPSVSLTQKQKLTTSSVFSLCNCGVQVIAAADEVVDSIDKEELAKYLSLNSDPEDEEAQVIG